MLSCNYDKADMVRVYMNPMYKTGVAVDNFLSAAGTHRAEYRAIPPAAGNLSVIHYGYTGGGKL